jgi:hypothetical protein
VPAKCVIAIYDLDKTTVSGDTRSFLTEAEKNGSVLAVEGELPKTFVITEEEEQIKIYLTPLSSDTLMKRFVKIQTKPVKEGLK